MHNFSYPDYRDLRDKAREADDTVAYNGVEATMAGSQGATSLQGEVVSGNFFVALGVPLRAGRALGDADDTAAAPPAVVLSEPLWRDRFGAAALSGQTIMLNGQSYTVVGVAAASFWACRLVGTPRSGCRCRNLLYSSVRTFSIVRRCPG